MRIAVIANNLRVAGGESVGRNVIRTLPLVAPMHEYLFLVPRGSKFQVKPPGVKADIVETHSRSFYGVAVEILRDIPDLLRRFSPDLVWALGNLPVRNPPAPQALLVHNPRLFYPESYYSRELWRYKQKDRLIGIHVRQNLRFVDQVFCQTQTAARRFRHVFNHGNVAIMPNAISMDIQTSQPPGKGHERLAAHRASFKSIALTRYYAHKNLELIVEAYSRFGKEQLAGTVCFLTIDPSVHPLARRLLRRAADEAPGQVLNLGPVPQAQLASLFREMDALLHPSTLESSSASFMEAMRFGIPILASDLDFAHEACGSAALYFEPHSPSGLAAAIDRLRQDSRLGRHLSQEGRRQLASVAMDWPDTVRSALDVLQVPHH